MRTPLRLLGSIAIPSSLLLACISSAGIGAPPGGSGDTDVGGSPGTGGTDATGNPTGGASTAPGTVPSPTGGTHATGGAPAIATGGTPSSAGGTSIGAGTGGMPSVGTSAGCDFTSAACQNPCSTLDSWEQTPCTSLLACLQNNSACVSAADPLCTTKGTYGNPLCSDVYNVNSGRPTVTTYVKCVCGLT